MVLNLIFITIAILIIVYDFKQFVLPVVETDETTRQNIITSIVGDVTAIMLILSVINGIVPIGLFALSFYLLVLAVMLFIVSSPGLEKASNWLTEEIQF